jgi:transcriptional regulator NrdR family protein
MARGSARAGEPGLNCPVCQQPTRVIAKDGADRRRECTACANRFTTEEVIKADRQRETEAVRSVLEAAERIKAAA